MRGWRLAAGAGFLALVLVPLASATREAFPGKPGKFPFQSNRDGEEKEKP